MLDNNYIYSVQGDLNLLRKIQKKLPRGFSTFWISQHPSEKLNKWPSLNIASLFDSEVSIPSLEEEVTFFIAKRNQKNKSNNYRLWWQDNNKSIPLGSFNKIVEKNTCLL